MRPSIEAKGGIAPQGSDGAMNLGHRLSQKTLDFRDTTLYYLLIQSYSWHAFETFAL